MQKPERDKQGQRNVQNTRRKRKKKKKREKGAEGDVRTILWPPSPPLFTSQKGRTHRARLTLFHQNSTRSKCNRSTRDGGKEIPSLVASEKEKKKVGPLLLFYLLSSQKVKPRLLTRTSDNKKKRDESIDLLDEKTSVRPSPRDFSFAFYF